MLSTDVPVFLFLVAQLFFAVAVVVFAFSGIDDVLYDLYFYLTSLRSRERGVPREISREELLEKPEGAFAIMLPAWAEANVLGPAVRNLVRTIDYAEYVAFIGVYPNDPETNAEADKLVASLPKVVKVVTPLPGPTCKADCLNAIVREIFRYEEEQGIRFTGVIMQDAEDVVHPLSLRLFNLLMPSADLVQIPVFSLPRSIGDLTGGHYMDEFAEVHSKEIPVRERFASIVPGAGVGTAYSRRALTTAAEGGEIFNTRSLTEDYEFSLRLRDAGLHQVFAKVKVKGDSSGGRWTGYASSYIATREYFPSGFWASVRQKTRWTIGISLQGWKNFGWRGSWRVKYLFWRDRKMLFFSHAILLGYLSIGLFAWLNAYEIVVRSGYRLRPLLPDGHFLWHIVRFNVGLMTYRIAQRHYWTYHHYGLKITLMTIPRYVWGAIINYLALWRALRIFAGHVVLGKRIGWDKTTHEFPDMPEGEPPGAVPQAA